MTKHATFLLGILIPLLACCTEDSDIPNNQDGDLDMESDTESIEDSGNTEMGDYDYEDSVTLSGQGFACQPIKCREGFLGPPNCVQIDEDRFNSSLSQKECQSDDDCDEEETCVQASTATICVDKSLPNYLAIYKWDDQCSWQLLVEKQIDCALIGAWPSGDEMARLEQCPDLPHGRYCVGDNCFRTIPLHGVTLVDAIACGENNNTYVLLIDYNVYPQRYMVFRANNDSLEIQGELAEDYYVYSATAPGNLFCTSDNNLWWNTQRSLRVLDGDSFTEELSIDDLHLVNEWGYVDFAFDSIQQNSNNPKELFIGIHGSYSTASLILNVEDKSHTIELETQNNWQTRMIADGYGGWWQMVGNQWNYIAPEGGEFPSIYIPDNQRVLTVSLDGLLLTQSLTRIFRFEKAAISGGTAMDSGLLFPGDYLGYVPAIRQFVHEIKNNKDQAFMVIQFRPTNQGF